MALANSGSRDEWLRGNPGMFLNENVTVAFARNAKTSYQHGFRGLCTRNWAEDRVESVRLRTER